MPYQAKVGARGLRELRRAFKAMGDKSFDRHFAQVHKRIAQQVIDAARPGVAEQSSRVAASMRAVTSATGAKVRVGGPDTPWAAGLIFGAARNRDRLGPTGRHYSGYNQFRSWWAGPYHIWPEVDELRDTIADDYAKAIDEFFGEQGVPR